MCTPCPRGTAHAGTTDTGNHTDDGSLTLVSALDSHAALSTDANGNLYVAKLGGAVRLGYYVADAVTHLVGPGSTFVPLAQGPSPTDYVDQSQTAFVNPWDVVIGTHIWVVDHGLNAVRILW